MSVTYPDMEKELHNGEMSEESTEAPSALEEEKKGTKSSGEEGEEGEAEGEYAEGLALFLIVLGLGLCIFLCALDMVRCICPPTSKIFL
jgi:hypothetical protein